MGECGNELSFLADPTYPVELKFRLHDAIDSSVTDEPYLYDFLSFMHTIYHQRWLLMIPFQVVLVDPHSSAAGESDKAD